VTRVATYARVYPAGHRGRAQLTHQQARLARTVGSWAGAAHVWAYADLGPAGPLGRPGLVRLLGDAERGCFEVVVVAGLDRISPSAEHAQAILARLASSGVGVVALAGAGRRRVVAAATAAGMVELARLLGW
jgi:DNA invertase Pin-like site-specific DNA recombinase